MTVWCTTYKKTEVLFILELIERKVVSKTPDMDLCEDNYCINDHYVCVIDGATNTSGIKFDGRAPGKIISDIIKQTVLKLKPNMGIKEIIAEINNTLIQYYKEKDIYKFILENPDSCPTASFVLYSHSRREVWMVGDCKCLIDGDLYTNEKKVDKVIAEVRALYLEGEIRKGKTVEELLESDSSLAVVKPFKQIQYYLQNTASESEYSYVAINGFNFNLNRIKTIKVSEQTKEIILASDGYQYLRPTLKETESELENIIK